MSEEKPDIVVETEKNKAELEFEKALELRNFEIDLFWKRGWFFGGLLVAIAGGYYEILINYDNNISQFRICFSFLAFLVSFAQCLMNRGSKYWQERWEYHTKNKEFRLGIDVTKTEKIFSDYSKKERKEKELIEAYILAKDDNFYTRSNRYSVTKLTFLVWDIITIFCFFVWLKDFMPHLYKLHDSHIINILNYLHYKRIFSYVILFHTIVFIYTLLFLFLKKNWWKNFCRNWLHCDSYKYFWSNFPFSFFDGGGGHVYNKLGKNLKPKPKKKTKPSKEEISRASLHNTYGAGNLE